MNAFGLWHCCVVLLISAFLTSCSSGSQLAPQGAMEQSIVRSDLNINASSAKPETSPLSGEIFTANKVSVSIIECSTKPPIFGWFTKFTGSGEAKGPYPGALLVKGHWYKMVGIGHASWGLYEKFTITSGKNTLSGHIVYESLKTPFPSSCATFGPEKSEGYLTYRSGSWSGPVTITYKIREGHLGEEKLH